MRGLQLPVHGPTSSFEPEPVGNAASRSEPQSAEPPVRGQTSAQQRALRNAGSELHRNGPEAAREVPPGRAGTQAAPAEVPAAGPRPSATPTVINNTTYIGEIRDSQVAIGNQGGATQIRNEIQEAARQCGDEIRRTAQSFRESLQTNQRTGHTDPAGTSPLSPTGNTLQSGAQQATRACRHVRVALQGMRADLPAMRLGDSAEQEIRRCADELDVHLAGTHPDLVQVRAGLEEIITVLSGVRRADDSPAGQKITDSLIRIRTARAQLDTSAVA